MVFSRRNNYLTGILTLFPVFLVLVFSAPGYAIPKREPFMKFDDLGPDQQDLGYQPMHEVTPPTDNSLHPNLTPFINESHPFPDYINKFKRGGKFPKHYLELLRTAPVDQVQSKVFNISDFENARRIGVAGFENKTAAPFKDKNAGYTVANQISQELQSYRKYQVIPPPRTSEDARLKITTRPQEGPNKEGTVNPEQQKRGPLDLPYVNEKRVDAVLIGAVTRYVDSYVDRRGEIKKSISSGVEFGAFLVNAKTGEVIWGARYVGSQTPNIRGFLEGKTHWLNKEELSRSAMKKVLKAFHDSQKQ